MLSVKSFANTARSCGHEEMFKRQLKRIEEMSDTLKALNDIIDCVNESNTRLECKLKAQEGRYRELSLNSAKQLADLEAQALELEQSRALSARLSAENKVLLAQLKERSDGVEES